ncbi:MAG: hypothetical protein F6K41_21330 [Symploca sp. SIO3E6]|nr:hypothetical protein [Caldora sp. SIO3E6]
MRLVRLLLPTLAGISLTGSPIAIAFAEALSPQVAVANPVVNPSIPTTTLERSDGVELKLPDWERITFDTLPIAEDGSFNATPEVVEKLGYNPSYSWKAGQTADQYLQLGAFEKSFPQSFQLQQYHLETIAALSDTSLAGVRLSELELLEWQTIGDLVLGNVVPGLANQRIADVPPIAELLEPYIPLFGNNSTLGDVLQEYPELKQLSLGDINLEAYDINSIPGLQVTPLEKFKNWENSLIEDVPGLKDVPWSKLMDPELMDPELMDPEFMDPFTLSGGIGKVDVVFGPKEAYRKRTISGSNNQGFQVPCNKSSCPHVEMTGLPTLRGRQWISGMAQMVKGGTGAFQGLMEPTGRHPFGSAFKVVLTNTDEAQAKADFGLYFRYCIPKVGCTPYNIGPFTWIPAHEKDWVVLGIGGISGGQVTQASQQSLSLKPDSGNSVVPGTDVAAAQTEVPTAVGEAYIDPEDFNVAEDNGFIDQVPEGSEVVLRGEVTDEPSFYERISNYGHGVLDVVGLFPVIGEFADGANVVLSLVESAAYAVMGDSDKARDSLGDAGLSVISIVPVAGDILSKGGKVGKLGKVISKNADEVADVGVKNKKTLEIVKRPTNEIVKRQTKPPKILGKAYRKEIKVANEFAERGHDVVLRGKKEGADLTIDDIKWELKTLESPTINAIRQNLRKGLKQGDGRVVIDGREVGLTHATAIRAIEQHQASGRLINAKEIRVYTTSGEYVWKP